MRVRKLTFVLALAPLAWTRCASCTNHPINEQAIRHHDTAIQYLQQGQCVQAEERCRLALEYGEEFEHPHNCLGMVAIQCHGDLKVAAQHFKDALSVNPDFAEAHNNLGTCFFRETPPDYDAACDQFRAALEIDPGYFDARENFGMCLMRRGTILGDRGGVEKRTELYREARSHLIRLLEMNPNNFNARHHLGFMDLTEKKFESAEQNFKRCIEIDPENAVCSYNLGNTYLETARCEAAIQAYIGALRGGSGDGGGGGDGGGDGGKSQIEVGARQNLGLAYEQCARKDGAIQAFLDRIKLDPGNPTHHFDLGRIYADKGLPDQATNEWENTVKLDPRYCAAHYELAMHWNKVLDSTNTIRRCQDFVACATEVNRNQSAPRWTENVARCKELVKKLEME